MFHQFLLIMSSMSTMNMIDLSNDNKNKEEKGRDKLIIFIIQLESEPLGLE